MKAETQTARRVRPLGDNVLVTRHKIEERTPGGLYIPQNTREKPQKATVLAVGPGNWSEKAGARVPIDLKAGDVVLLGKYAGTDIELDGEKCLFLREAEILGVVG